MRNLFILALLLTACGRSDLYEPVDRLGPQPVIVNEYPTTVVEKETVITVEQARVPSTVKAFGTLVPWKAELMESHGIVDMTPKGWFFDFKMEDRIDGSVVTDNGISVVDDWCVEEPCTSTVHVFPDSWEHIVQFIVVGTEE